MPGAGCLITSVAKQTKALIDKLGPEYFKLMD
jgi:hypothetical protein